MLDGLVGEKYGSADEKAPAEVYLTEGEDFTMEPEIQGITIGAITYTWYKNGEVIDGETGPALTIGAYDPTVDKGDYYLKATQGTRTVRVYWRVARPMRST